MRIIKEFVLITKKINNTLCSVVGTGGRGVMFQIKNMFIPNRI